MCLRVFLPVVSTAIPIANLLVGQSPLRGKRDFPLIKTVWITLPHQPLILSQQQQVALGRGQLQTQMGAFDATPDAAVSQAEEATP